MEIPAHAEFVRGGRGLAIGSTLPLLWKPNKESVYLLACEEADALADFRVGQKASLIPSELVLC